MSKNIKSLIYPEKDYGQLFDDVAMSHLLKDGKNWADAEPLFSPERIKEKYLGTKDNPDFTLEIFLTQNFILPISKESNDFVSDTTLTTEQHINELWNHLKRDPSKTDNSGTLINLPHPYIVPGGRFNEIYYWDTYFTMLGLKVSREYQLIQFMVDNFAWLIQNFGFIPNGNRSYYLSRSQPPFFSMMVELLASITNENIKINYLNELLGEYHFWMDELNNRTVLIEHGEFLNKYHDNLNGPRTEMYAQDMELGKLSGDDFFFQNIKAACESGWDFSSRWLKTTDDLSTIQTTHYLPVDLNCLLYNLEITIASVFELKGEVKNFENFSHKAESRKKLILEKFWNEKEGYFFDYNYINSSLSDVISIAGIFPLFVGICPNKEAQRSIKYMEKHLLRDGGLVTTNITSGQQWDAPNGWAPLQWVAFKALKNYGNHVLANDLGNRWMAINDKVFQSTGKMLEKYNVEDVYLESGGGEYPVQDGFGWTNGVYLALKETMNQVN